MAVIRNKNSQKKDGRGEAAAQFSSQALMKRLGHAGLLDTPVDIYALAEYIGLEVVEEPMDNELSGYLEMHGDTWVVGVNVFHHPNRKRFTIAHEIAHFILHSDNQTSFRDKTFARRSVKPNMMEREADSFAASILMPEDKVKRLIASGVTSLSELAANFRVSALAMKYRVQNLGYKVNQ